MYLVMRNPANIPLTIYSLVLLSLKCSVSAGATTINTTKDIEKTLPEIVCRGQIGVTGKTLQEIYEEVKRRGLFGQVEDC